MSFEFKIQPRAQGARVVNPADKSGGTFFQVPFKRHDKKSAEKHGTKKGAYYTIPFTVKVTDVDEARAFCGIDGVELVKGKIPAVKAVENEKE